MILFPDSIIRSDKAITGRISEILGRESIGRVDTEEKVGGKSWVCNNFWVQHSGEGATCPVKQQAKLLKKVPLQ